MRVHADGESAARAQALRAQAFTSGEDVFFGEGRYAPDSRPGERLLAHELTHVVQQRRGRSAGNEAAAEREADRAATAMGTAGRGAAIRESAPAALQCKAEDGVKLAEPSKDPEDPIGKRPTDVYGSGGLTEAQWNQHLKTAKDTGDSAARQSEFELLFKDVVRSAGASAVVDTTKINWLVGAKPHDNKTFKPGLNLTPFGTSDLGAAAYTGYVNSKGQFFGLATPLESADPSLEVAIVMSVQDFDSGKPYAVGVLRHEMVHADHARDALAALASFEADSAKGSRKGKADLPRARFQAWMQEQQKTGRYSPVEAALIAEQAGSATVAGSPNSELLAHFEGFMTQFLLAKPPIDMEGPPFGELSGSLRTTSGVLPWASSNAAVRAEALGRLRKFYVEELDKPHRDAFHQWVDKQMAIVDADHAFEGLPSGSIDEKKFGDIGKVVGGKEAREANMHGHFIRSLREMLSRADQPSTPMAR